MISNCNELTEAAILFEANGDRGFVGLVRLFRSDGNFARSGGGARKVLHLLEIVRQCGAQL